MKPYYQEDNITVYNHDCMEIMDSMEDESVDLVVTDPPYNIGDENKRTKQGNFIKSNKDAWGQWDSFDKKEYDEMMRRVISTCYRLLKDGGAFYMFTAREDNGFFIREAVKAGFTYANQIVIIKTNPLPHFCKTNWRSGFELCMYLTKGKPKTFNFLEQPQMINVFYYLIGKKESRHPTEKPLKVVRQIIEVSSNRGDVVLDPFLGSGTTARACKNTGRRCVGMEISEEYCQTIVNRLGQEVLFDEDF